MTKIEEKIDNAARYYAYNNGYRDDNRDRYEAFKAGADFALRNQWVSVETALPELNHNVLVTYADHIITGYECVGIANYDTVDGKWFSALSRHNIKFWMPIPPLSGARKEGM